jgi:hypothetical protein
MVGLSGMFLIRELDNTGFHNGLIVRSETENVYQDGGS